MARTHQGRTPGGRGANPQSVLWITTSIIVINCVGLSSAARRNPIVISAGAGDRADSHEVVTVGEERRDATAGRAGAGPAAVAAAEAVGASSMAGQRQLSTTRFPTSPAVSRSSGR